jgi:hypothetical protein
MFFAGTFEVAPRKPIPVIGGIRTAHIARPSSNQIGALRASNDRNGN